MEKREDPPPKVGAGHAEAFFRQGLRELRSAMYPDSNIAQQVSEYGLYGTRTPGEVAESRRSDFEISRWDDEGGLIPQDGPETTEPRRDDKGREDKGMDKE